MKPRCLYDSQALIALYKLLGEEGYQDAFVRFARAAIINTCFLGVEVMTVRTKISIRIKGQLGVPLTVYPWYLLSSLGILGDYNP